MANPLSFTWNLLCGLQQVSLLLWALASFFFFFFLYKLENLCGLVKMGRSAAFAQTRAPHSELCCTAPGCQCGAPAVFWKCRSAVGEERFPHTWEVPQSIPRPLELLGAFHLHCLWVLFPSEPRPPGGPQETSPQCTSAGQGHKIQWSVDREGKGELRSFTFSL